MRNTDADRMQCMEVWGGNQAAERCFRTPGLKICVYSRPYGEATGGGDVYYVSSCASGRITRMLVADVSGHGEMVSHLAVGLRDLMRRNVNFIKQIRFVRAMNQQFAEFSDQGGFATALVSTFFAPTKSLAICNAGHPTPLVYRRTEAEWSELKKETKKSKGMSNMPLGIMDDVSYREFDVPLETGDMVLSFSDAVTESTGADGRQLGQAGVLHLVRELDVKEPDDVIPALIERIGDLSENNLKQDDTTIILCQASGDGPSLKNNLLAPFRLFGPVTDRVQLG